MVSVRVYGGQSARVIKGIPKRRKRKNEIKEFFLILLILSILSIIENGQAFVEKKTRISSGPMVYGV
jgi:hypothetical protein